MKGKEVANAVADCVAGKANSRMLFLRHSFRSQRGEEVRCGKSTYVSLKPKVPLI